jgi:hypothetical protein
VLRVVDQSSTERITGLSTSPQPKFIRHAAVVVLAGRLGNTMRDLRSSRLRRVLAVPRQSGIVTA